jgi:hypothetical protein
VLGLCKPAAWLRALMPMSIDADIKRTIRLWSPK